MDSAAVEHAVKAFLDLIDTDVVKDVVLSEPVG